MIDFLFDIAYLDVISLVSYNSGQECTAEVGRTMLVSSLILVPLLVRQVDLINLPYQKRYQEEIPKRDTKIMFYSSILGLWPFLHTSTKLSRSENVLKQAMSLDAQ